MNAQWNGTSDTPTDNGDKDKGSIMELGRIELASYDFALFTLYLLLVLFIGLQLGRIAYYRHKIMSFQVGFLIQCFFLALLRCIFFLIYNYVTDVNWLYLFIYWIPINIQYSTFSLLVVYYGHLQHKQKAEWYTFKRRYFSVWFGTNMIFLVLAIVWIVLGVEYDNERAQEPIWLNQIHGYFSGTVFFVLVLVLAWHTWKVYRLMKIAKGHQTVLLAKVSWNKILIVTVALFTLFTSRCVYDFITAMDNDLAVDVSSGSTYSALFTFIAFCLWEIIPIILVLVLFGNVHATTLGAFYKEDHKKKANPYIRSKGENQTDTLLGQNYLKAALFNDPRRYDSDDETTPLHRSGGYTSAFGNNSPYLHSISSINTLSEDHDSISSQ